MSEKPPSRAARGRMYGVDGIERICSGLSANSPSRFADKSLTRQKIVAFFRLGSMGGKKAQTGFTLTEVMVASAILAFAVISITQMVTVGQTHSLEALHHRRGQSLAEAMLDEMLALPFRDPEGADSPGPDAGESDRSNFDDIDDYNGYIEPFGTVVDAAGEPYGTAFDRFSRSVTVEPATQVMPGVDKTIAGVWITVTVTDDRGMTWTLRRFVADPQEPTS